MSLGTGALMVGGANSDLEGIYPWWPHEQEPPLYAATNQHSATERNSVEPTYMYPDLTLYWTNVLNWEGRKTRC